MTPLPWTSVLRQRLPTSVVRLLRRAPVLGTLLQQRDDARAEVQALRTALERHEGCQGLWVPPGHFYSPLPDLADVQARRDAIFSRDCEVPGVELNAAGQLAVLKELSPLVAEHPFPVEKGGATRYYFGNDFFSYGDALALYGLLRWLKPRRYLEVGSGFSSAIALDVNERHFGGAMEILLVEPYPERLLELVRPGDLDRVELMREPLHRIPNARFAALEPGDVLFVDSTHVSKVGSDVNRIFFEILPRLPAGVYVHVHDVFFPFEYPESWILKGIAWNEAYLLRAFLQYNRAFEIVLFNDYLAQRQRDELLRLVPPFLKNPGGSLWLRKV
jgi:hypothetical protein